MKTSPVRPLVAALLVVLAASPFALALDIPELPAEEEALVAGRFEEAAAAFEARARALAGKDGTDAALYQAARAWLLAEKPEVAGAALASLLRQAPASPLRFKARFLQAAASARAGDPAAACRILEEELARLSSPPVRDGLAGLLRAEAARLAEKARFATAGPDGKPNPDLVRAWELLEKARKTAGPGLEIDLELSRAAMRAGNPARAADLLQPLVDRRGPGADALALDLAKAMGAAGKALLARPVLESFLAEFKDSPLAPEALDLLARTWMATSKTPHGVEAALRAWQALVERFPSDPRAPDAARAVLAALRERGEADRGIAFCDLLASRRPGSDVEAEAAFARAGFHLAAGRHGKAAEGFRAFVAARRDHPLAVQAFESLRRAELGAAGALAARGDLPAAAGAYRAFLDAWPVAPEAPDTAVLLGDTLSKAGDVAAAVEAWRRAAERYDAVAPRALLAAAELCERTPGRGTEAVSLYEALQAKAAKTDLAARAAERLQALKARRLSLEVVRAFRAGEAPFVRLRARNVENVKFHLNRLDLEDLFRSGATLRVVDRLDLDAVKPDRSFDHAVAGARPCEAVEENVPIPVEGPGAWVVRAETEEFRARALLLVSDLSLVLKTVPARGQALAFVRDERTGEPVSGARLVAAASGKVGIEASTGAEGVFSGPLVPADPRAAGKPGVYVVEDPEEEGEGSGDAGSGGAQAGGPEAGAVLASWKGHFAVAPIPSGDPAGGDFPTRGFLYTARPLYRPGEKVEFRGIFRASDALGYRTPDGEEIAVRVVDPAERAVHEETLRVNEFGAAASAFVLSAAAKAGTWTVRARLRAEWVESKFEVRAYRRPGFFLDVVPESEDVAEGEDIRLVIRARTRTGQTIAGVRVSWEAWFNRYDRNRVRDPRRARSEKPPASGEAFTDAAGEIRAAFPSPRMDRLCTILVKARAVDVTGSPVAGHAVVFSGPAALAVRLTPAQDRFRPGAAAAFRLRAMRLSGSPAAVAGEATLEKKGGDAFELLWRKPVAVDSTGEARLELGTLPEGEYRVRYEAVDRRGTLVIDEEGFKVEAGAAGACLLALSADRDSYVEGEVARIGVRGEGLRGAALFTVEAEGVLDWKVVRPAGSGEVLLPVRDSYAPNAMARIAAPGNGRLLEGECEIRVDRKIQVALEPDRNEYAPGGAVVLTLRASDARGRPVKAEFSVAAVDEALLRLEPDRTPEIHGFFYNFRRTYGVLAASSCGFSWASEAAAIDPDLLRERKQQEGSEDRKVVVLEKEAAQDALDQESNYLETAEGIGGGYGGRFGGRRNLRAYGGGRHTESALLEGPAERTAFLPAAFWDARVRTGADGKARVEFALPHDLTTWKVVARGCGTGAVFGEGRVSFAAAKPLSLDLDLPASLAEGDRFRATAVVRSIEPDDAVRVEISASGAGDPQAGAVACGAGRAGLHAAEFAAGAGVSFVEVRAQARGKVGGDAVAVRVPIRPAGNLVTRGFGGMAAPRASHTFLLPTNRVRGGERLRVRVDPGLRFCIDEALRDLEEYPYGCIEQTVSRFVPAVAALDAYKALGLADPALEARFRAMAERGLELLYGHQTAGGGFGWWGRDRKEGDLLMTSYAVLAMATCRARDLRVDEGCFGRARDALVALARARGADPDGRAFALYALSVAGAAPEEDLLLAASRRPELAPASVAVLSLALREAGRAAMAREFAESLAAGAEAGWEARRGFTTSPEEAAGWALLAMVRAGVEGGSLEAGLRRVLSARRAGRWSSTRATGAAVMALSAYLERFRDGAPASRVRVFLNGAELKSFAFDANAGPVEVLAPADALRDGENRLEVAAEGRAALYSGEFAWRASDPVAGEARLLSVAREYRAVSAAEAGDEELLEEGGARADWNPRLVRARPGDRILVRVRLKPEEALSYVMIEDPVPGGAEVVGLAGGAEVEAFEDRGTHAAFFFTEVPREGVEVVYALAAVRAGRFSAAPVRAEPMYRPEGLAFGAEAVAEIDESLERAPGPGATFREAEAAFGGRRFADASALFERLLAFPLREEARRLALERLLDASLELDRPEAAVRAFGALAEAGGAPAPDRLRRVAAAHADAGQGEIALGLFQRVSGALTREVAETALVLGAADVGGALGVPTLSHLVPDGPDLEEAAFEGAKALRKPGKKPDLEACAAAHFRFAVDFPGSPRKEESWSLGLRALLDAGAWAPCAREGARHARMFPKGPRLDEAIHYAACALLAAGKIDEASRLAGDLLSREFPKPDGKTGPSRFLHNAEHLLGQVLEVRGDFEGALEQYGKAADYIDDARRARARLTETRLEADGIVAVRPGQTGAVPVAYRNTPSVAVRVYPVDLELFFALHKGMGRADRMALAGVTPAVRFEWAPEGGADHGLHRADLPLPRLETGAWFVVLNAGVQEASALVVVSDLRVFVSEAGTLARVEVRDGQGKPVWGARVLVGDGNSLLSTGFTDPRGFFEGIGGTGGWVLASEGGRYALGRLK